jgi:hypothetical protein
VTILTDIDEAIEVEREKQRLGKRAKRMTLQLGEPAAREMARQWGGVEAGTRYRGIEIERTDLFDGWELRC